jgi:hypothetical protein
MLIALGGVGVRQTFTGAEVAGIRVGPLVGGEIGVWSSNMEASFFLP